MVIRCEASTPEVVYAGFKLILL